MLYYVDKRPKPGRLFFKERLSFIMTNEVMEQSRDEVEYGKLYHPQKDVKVIKKDGSLGRL